MLFVHGGFIKPSQKPRYLPMQPKTNRLPYGVDMPHIKPTCQKEHPKKICHLWGVIHQSLQGLNLNRFLSMIEHFGDGLGQYQQQ